MKPKGIPSLVVAKYIQTIIGIKKIESAKNKIILSMNCCDIFWLMLLSQIS